MFKLNFQQSPIICAQAKVSAFCWTELIFYTLQDLSTSVESLKHDIMDLTFVTILFSNLLLWRSRYCFNMSSCMKVLSFRVTISHSMWCYMVTWNQRLSGCKITVIEARCRFVCGLFCPIFQAIPPFFTLYIFCIK